VGLSASDPVLCLGESSTLTASGASTYAWSHGLGSGSSKPVSPSATTTYTVTGTDLNGCTGTAQVTITVNPLPIITLTATPDSIRLGDTALLTASGGVDYAWSHGLGVAVSHTVSPGSTTTYTVTGTDANGCVGSAMEELIVLLPGIEGHLTYMNIFSTPIKGAGVGYGPPGGTPLATDLSDNAGYYYVHSISAGTYSPIVNCTHPWGGGNALDALMIMRHFSHLDTLDQTGMLLGDVNLNSGVNSTDAYLVAARFAEVVNGFPTGDWYFEPDTLLFTAIGDVTHNIGGACYGDVMRDYIPGTKGLKAIPIIPEPTTVVSGSFLLPVSNGSNHTIGAYSIEALFAAEDFELIDVLGPEEQGVLVWKCERQTLRIAWYMTAEAGVKESQPLFYLKLRYRHHINAFAPLQAIKGITGISGTPEAQPHPEQYLRITDIYPVDASGSLFTQAYPNPFGDALIIKFTLPVETRYSGVLSDISGRMLMQFGQARIEAGEHQLELNTEGLAPGVYFLEMRYGPEVMEGCDVIKVIRH
jgi:hypothetical protein